MFVNTITRQTFHLSCYKLLSRTRSKYDVIPSTNLTLAEPLLTSVISIQIKVEKVKARLTGQVSTQPEDDRIRSVLMGKYANGNVDKAVDLLVLWDKTSIGIIEGVDHDVRLLGAENNGKVTCYLDSLLFALYARLDSFEAGPNIFASALLNMKELTSW